MDGAAEFSDGRTLAGRVNARSTAAASSPCSDYASLGPVRLGSEEARNVEHEGAMCRRRMPHQLAVENLRTFVHRTPPLKGPDVRIDDPVFRNANLLIRVALFDAIIPRCTW